MRTVFVAAIAVMLVASPAMARCYTTPDPGNVNTGVNHTICLQDDISAAQKQQQQQTNLDSQLNTMQQQMQQQKFDQMMTNGNNRLQNLNNF